MSSAISISRQLYRINELIMIREQLRIDPSYQREGRIWSRERQQLLIDSILNGFEIPQIYLHRLRPPEFDETGARTLAVVDGRQRLEAIWEFTSGDLPLARDFSLLDEEPPTDSEVDSQGRYGGMNIYELEREAPQLFYRFFDYELQASVIETDDQEMIEELFFRLNEGVPLTPAEKRNRGALFRDIVFPLVNEQEIFSIARFRNRRQSHQDLLLRILYLEASGVSATSVPDMKRRQLDSFAASFRPNLGETWDPDEEAAARDRLTGLIGRVLPTLEAMREIFTSSDVLLSTTSRFLEDFLVIRQTIEEGADLPARWQFEEFARAIEDLRGTPDERLDSDAVDLLEEYGQPYQGSTTGSYLQRRVELLLRYLRGDLILVTSDHTIELPDPI